MPRWPENESWAQRHGTTAAAAAVASAVTIPYTFVFVGLLGDIRSPERVDASRVGRLTELGAQGGEIRAALIIIAVVVAAILAVTITTIIGIIARRHWGRDGGMVVFGFLGVVATAASLGGLFVEPPQPGAWWGLATGIGSLLVSLLLFLPATLLDFDRAEIEHEQRWKYWRDPWGYDPP